MMSYIGLFDSAGGGCYGFKQEEFVATNEPIERRLDGQRYNKKCKYKSGYICDGICNDETLDRILE